MNVKMSKLVTVCADTKKNKLFTGGGGSRERRRRGESRLSG
jgi:hypothetical protein